VRLVNHNIKEATHHFSVTLDEALPLLQGNAQQIEQVVVNLLVNALHALPDKERGVTLLTRQTEDGKNAVLEVRDEGVGISENNLAHIMEPFFTTRRESGGTGLGLSVSSRIVKSHGGRLEFSSRPGKGTTALLILPFSKKELC